MLLRDKLRLNYNIFNAYILYCYQKELCIQYTPWEQYYPFIIQNLLQSHFEMKKTIERIRREVEAMICLHKLIYMSRLTKELCRFTSYSTSLHCRCQVERHTERTLLLTKCNSQHNDDYYSISYALLWTTF